MTQNDADYKQNTQATYALKMAGDVTGRTGFATVQAIQNNSVSSAAPNDGDFLVWESGASQWQPSPIAARPLIGNVTDQSGFSTYTVGANDVSIFSSSSISVFLPATATVGRMLFLSGSVNIHAFLGTTVGTVSVYIATNGAVIVCYDGANWGVV